MMRMMRGAVAVPRAPTVIRNPAGRLKVARFYWLYLGLNISLNLSPVIE